MYSYEYNYSIDIYKRVTDTLTSLEDRQSIARMAAKTLDTSESDVTVGDINNYY